MGVLNKAIARNPAIYAGSRLIEFVVKKLGANYVLKAMFKTVIFGCVKKFFLFS